MTAGFQRVDGSALGVVTNLAAGTYSWSAAIADYAGNVVSNAGTFYAPGTTTPLAFPASSIGSAGGC